MVWMEPLGSTDSTTPMCSSQTIRSPGCGLRPAPFGIALPVRWAQAYTSSTRPKPWPLSPSGTPAWRAAQETKYAHHGPTPLPAVACRYCAMRAESFEPGGCSAWPTSPRTRFSTAWPAGVPCPVGDAARVAAADVGRAAEAPRPAFALCSAPAKLVVDGDAVVVVAGWGASTECSSAMRAIVT